jgi:hypothetical protein
MLVVAHRVFISIENISRPFSNAVGVQPLTGIAVRLRINLACSAGISI